MVITGEDVSGETPGPPYRPTGGATGKVIYKRKGSMGEDQEGESREGRGGRRRGRKRGQEEKEGERQDQTDGRQKKNKYGGYGTRAARAS